MKTYTDAFGVKYSQNKKILLRAPSNIEQYNVPDYVTEIGDYAFDGCKSLTSITIPNSVAKIGEWAFVDCESLTSITASGTNYTFEDGVLFNNNKTKIILYLQANKENHYNIPDSVTEIGFKAFAGCSSLISITIPYLGTEIIEGTFEGCKRLKTINGIENSPLYYALKEQGCFG